MEKFDDYQKHIADNFRKYPDADKVSERSLSYLILKLNGEAGEIAEKFGKLLRDNPDYLETGVLPEEFRIEMGKEFGDVQWYISELAGKFGFRLSEIAQMNIEKLTSRRERGVLGGSGDNR